MFKVIACLGPLVLTAPALAWESPDGVISAPSGESGALLDAASQHFSLGVDFYRAGNWDAAFLEFETAYRLSQKPDLLHNLSMTAERQGRIEAAIRYEEQFQRSPRDVPLTEREVDEVQGRLSRLRAQLARPAASSRPVEATERRTVAPGAIGLLAGGGIGLAVGIGCGVGALATRAEIYSPAGIYAEQFEALANRQATLDRVGIAFDVVGGMALAAGAAWALWARYRAPSTRTTQLHARSPGAALAMPW